MQASSLPVQLPQAVQAWGRPEFSDIVKQEILQLDPAHLPLQQGMSFGSYASGDSLSVMVLSSCEHEGSIQVKTGIMFTGIVGGCHCADDPSPNNEHPEYCEVMFEIDKDSAITNIHLIKKD